MQRLRVRFTRGEEIKFISHLDITRVWERAMTRAGVNIAFSEGFNPHPRLSLAVPLSVGMTSKTELLDVIITSTVSPPWFVDALNNQLPNGVRVLDARVVSMQLPSLQAQVRKADYRVTVEKAGGPDDGAAAVESLLARETIPWSHERDTGTRQYDLRALIDDVKLVSEDGETCTLEMRLRCDNAGSGRPEQVTKALGFPEYPLTICRTRLILES